MKYPTLIILMAALLAGCDNPPTTGNSPNTPELFADADPSKFPVIVVDEQHALDGTNSPNAYQLPAADGIRVDISKYQFTYGTSKITPNMVMLVLYKDRAFKLIDPVVTNLYVVDRKTLRQISDKGFPGFRSGENWLLMIGRELPSDVTSTNFTAWVGKIEVK